LNLLDHQFVALKATDDQETAIGVFERDRTALPVTDSSGVLIGIVTIDDVLRVAEAAATEDIQKIGGYRSPRRTLYPHRPATDDHQACRMAGRPVPRRTVYRYRHGVFFEKEIEKAVVLALFVPLIISSGGNSGSQASTSFLSRVTLFRLTEGHIRYLLFVVHQQRG
jgi:magnesium transporter